MKPSDRMHRLNPLLRWLLTAAVVSLVGVTTGPWPRALAAPLTGAPALQSTPPTSPPHSRARPASGPHSDGADAVLRDRQRAGTGSSPATGTGSMLKRADQQFLSKALASGTAEVELARLAQSRAQDAELKRFADHMVEDHTRVNGELRALGTRSGMDWPEDRNSSSGSRSMGTGTGMGTSTGTPPGTSPASGPALSSGAASGTASGPGAHALPGSTGSGGTGMSASSGMPALSASAQRTMDRLQGLSGADFDRVFIQQMVSDHKSAVADFQRAASSSADSDVRRFAQQTLPGLQEHLQQAQTLSGRLGSRSR